MAYNGSKFAEGYIRSQQSIANQNKGKNQTAVNKAVDNIVNYYNNNPQFKAQYDRKSGEYQGLQGVNYSGSGSNYADIVAANKAKIEAEAQNKAREIAEQTKLRSTISEAAKAITNNNTANLNNINLNSVQGLSFDKALENLNREKLISSKITDSDSVNAQAMYSKKAAALKKGVYSPRSWTVLDEDIPDVANDIAYQVAKMPYDEVKELYDDLYNQYTKIGSTPNTSSKLGIVNKNESTSDAIIRQDATLQILRNAMKPYNVSNIETNLAGIARGDESLSRAVDTMGNQVYDREYNAAINRGLSPEEAKESAQKSAEIIVSNSEAGKALANGTSENGVFTLANLTQPTSATTTTTPNGTTPNGTTPKDYDYTGDGGASSSMGYSLEDALATTREAINNQLTDMYGSVPTFGSILDTYNNYYNSTANAVNQINDALLNQLYDSQGSTMANLAKVLRSNRQSGLTSGANTGAINAANALSAQNIANEQATAQQTAWNNVLTNLLSYRQKQNDIPSNAYNTINSLANAITEALGNTAGYDLYGDIAAYRNNS